MKKRIISLLSLVSLCLIFYLSHSYWVPPLLGNKDVQKWINTSRAGYVFLYSLETLGFINEGNNWRSHQAQSPDRIRALYQLMKDTNDVLDVCEITYWTQGGVLLGSVRHGGHIPWDDDLDIDIKSADKEKLRTCAVPLMKALGYLISNFEEEERDDYLMFYGDFIHFEEEGFQQPSIEIFYSNKDETGDWTKPKFQSERFAHDDLFPLKRYRYGEIDVWGPNNPLPYLESYLGINYARIAYRGFDHCASHEDYMVPFILRESDLLPAQDTGPIVDNRKRIYDAYKKHYRLES